MKNLILLIFTLLVLACEKETRPVATTDPFVLETPDTSEIVTPTDTTAQTDPLSDVRHMITRKIWTITYETHYVANGSVRGWKFNADGSSHKMRDEAVETRDWELTSDTTLVIDGLTGEPELWHVTELTETSFKIRSESSGTTSGWNNVYMYR
jgi:hypothetical protein